MNTLHDLTARDNRGNEIDFSQYKGKVLLIVNTASKCGFTPQYKELEDLHQRYKEAGLVVIGFPCDQFGHQEPGNDDAIASFCEVNFGVSFPLMQKIDVNGKNASPVFLFLKEHAGGLFGKKIIWNFTKFLVSKDGSVVKRFSPLKNPMSLEKDIIKALKG